MMTGTVRSFGRGGRPLKKGASAWASMSRCGGLERMKIGIGDADVPGDQAMRSDLDAFFRHDERAVHQREIADRAGAILAQGERAAGVTGNMVADSHGARRSWCACGEKSARSRNKILRRRSTLGGIGLAHQSPSTRRALFTLLIVADEG